MQSSKIRGFRVTNILLLEHILKIWIARKMLNKEMNMSQKLNDVYNLKIMVKWKT